MEHNMIHTASSAAAQVAKIAPVAGILWWNAFISAVPAITMILAMVYLVLQIGYLVWKWKKEHKESKDKN